MVCREEIGDRITSFSDNRLLITLNDRFDEFESFLHCFVDDSIIRETDLVFTAVDLREKVIHGHKGV